MLSRASREKSVTKGGITAASARTSAPISRPAKKWARNAKIGAKSKATTVGATIPQCAKSSGNRRACSSHEMFWPANRSERPKPGQSNTYTACSPDSSPTTFRQM